MRGLENQNNELKQNCVFSLMFYEKQKNWKKWNLINSKKYLVSIKFKKKVIETFLWIPIMKHNFFTFGSKMVEWLMLTQKWQLEHLLSEKLLC